MTPSVITYLCARPRLKWFYRLSTPQPVFVCARVWDYSAAILSGTLISWLAARRYLLTGSRWWCWLDGARRHPSFWLANNWNPSLFRSIYAAMCVCACTCVSNSLHFICLGSFSSSSSLFSPLLWFISPFLLSVLSVHTAMSLSFDVTFSVLYF